VTVLDEISLQAQSTSYFAPRHLRCLYEAVAFGAWPGELLKVREVLDHYALLLARDGAAASLLHEV
jgi:hypothetical protein